MPPGRLLGGVSSGSTHPGGSSGQTEDTLDRFYLSASSGTSRCPLEELVEVAEERNIWISLLKVLPRDPDKRQKVKHAG